MKYVVPIHKELDPQGPIVPILNHKLMHCLRRSLDTKHSPCRSARKHVAHKEHNN